MIGARHRWGGMEAGARPKRNGVPRPARSDARCAVSNDCTKTVKEYNNPFEALSLSLSFAFLLGFLHSLN
jgi:hypothetical protein